MSSRPKKKRYSLEEVEDMLMNDPDSGDSDLDLGEDFAALDIESNRDEESKNDNNNNEMESEYEESDNEIVLGQQQMKKMTMKMRKMK